MHATCKNAILLALLACFLNVSAHQIHVTNSDVSVLNRDQLLETLKSGTGVQIGSPTNKATDIYANTLHLDKVITDDVEANRIKIGNSLFTDNTWDVLALSGGTEFHVLTKIRTPEIEVTQGGIPLVLNDGVISGVVDLTVKHVHDVERINVLEIDMSSGAGHSAGTMMGVGALTTQSATGSFLGQVPPLTRPSLPPPAVGNGYLVIDADNAITIQAPEEVRIGTPKLSIGRAGDGVFELRSTAVNGGVWKPVNFGINTIKTANAINSGPIHINGNPTTGIHGSGGILIGSDMTSYSFNPGRGGVGEAALANDISGVGDLMAQNIRLGPCALWGHLPLAECLRLSGRELELPGDDTWYWQSDGKTWDLNLFVEGLAKKIYDLENAVKNLQDALSRNGIN